MLFLTRERFSTYLKLVASICGVRRLRHSEALFLLLFEYYKKHPKKHFVQIGSNDGVNGDPLYAHIVREKLSGILVEPVGYIFKTLVNNHAGSKHLIFENVAIGSSSKQLPFYRLAIPEGLSVPPWAHMLGSFLKSTILGHKAQLPDIDKWIVEEEVTQITFKQLIDKHCLTSISLLHIDAEGFDYEIIRTIDFSMIDIDLILFEHAHLSKTDFSDCSEMLQGVDYTLFSLEGDTLCIRRHCEFLLNKANRLLRKTGTVLFES
jgi:FkbM family methyltransferase